MDNNKILSETEEMYLVTIRKVCEFCSNTPVPIPEIAKELGVQPVSASQMVNKLAENGFVKYLPYKGVELTDEGMRISSRILRHRRLWEVFFVKVLNMEVNEAEALACQIEHVTSRDVASRLQNFLGDPKVCFHGAPIPQDEDEEPIHMDGVILSSLQVGQSGHVIRFNCDSAIEKFLTSEEIRQGVLIKVLAVGNDGDLLLGVDDKCVHLSIELADSIVVGNPSQKHHSGKEKQMNVMPLSKLSIGQKGVIQKINFKGALRQRLLAMGLVTGETIQVKKIAPLGDPVDYVVKGYDLSLRKSEADDVFVTIILEE
jgi:DtxR family Mn-dependent transcriptional regulator